MKQGRPTNRQLLNNENCLYKPINQPLQQAIAVTFSGSKQRPRFKQES